MSVPYFARARASSPGTIVTERLINVTNEKNKNNANISNTLPDGTPLITPKNIFDMLDADLQIRLSQDD